MSEDKNVPIGHNQNPIEDEAIKLIDKTYDQLLLIKQYISKSILGKNNTVRKGNIFIARLYSSKAIADLKSWNAVIKAKNNGVDIHSAPLKHHKLEIVGGSEYKFGQYIVDKKWNGCDDKLVSSKQLSFDFKKEQQ